MIEQFPDTISSQVPRAEEQQRGASFMAAARRLGSLLSGRNKLAEVVPTEIQDVQIGIVYEDVAADDPVEQRSEAPKVVSYVSELTSDESIGTEKDSLATKLALNFDPDPEAQQSREYYDIRYKLGSTHTEPYPRISISSTDTRAESLQAMLVSGPKLARGTWLDHVNSDSLRSVLIEAKDEPIIIPTSNIVNAGGMDSWQGRGINGMSEKESQHDNVVRTSIDTIEMYADMHSIPPPVESATAYVQPNGVVFYAVSNGAHRTAAAMRRGDETIATTQLKVQLIERNCFDMPDQK